MPAISGTNPKPSGALVALAAAIGLVLIQPRDAETSCSLIPPADEFFLGDNNEDLVGGLIDSPLGSPGREVRVAVDPCESPTPPLFTQPASSNVVQIRVIRPDGSRSAPVTASGRQVGNCPNAVSPCRSLVFDIPTGVTAAGAGPAELEVQNGSGGLVVKIGALFRITGTGCSTDSDGNRTGRQAEQTFSHFTILPTSNSVAQLASGGASTFRATVDGGGNLLIPLDYTGVLGDEPGTPVATLISGSAPIPASSASDPVTIPEKLAAIADPSKAIRSFTLKGRPLPPLLVLTASTTTPRIFGAIDAEESVLRIAKYPDAGDTELFDLNGRRPANGAPLVIPFDSLSIGESVHLDWLRRVENLIAYAVAERGAGAGGTDLNFDGDKLDQVGFIKNTAVEEPLWGFNTFLDVAAVPFGESSIAGISVSDGYVAMLQNVALDGALFRVFDDMGNRRDDEAWPRSVELQEMVSHAPVKQHGPLSVFFHKPLEIHSEVKASPARPIDPWNFRAVGLTISPDGRHLYAGPFESNGQILGYRIGGDGLPAAQVASAQAGNDDELPGMAFSEDGLSLYVTGTATDKVYMFSRIAETGELVPIGGGFVAVDSPGRIAIHGNDVYVTSHETHTLTHLRRDTGTGQLEPIRSITDDSKLRGAYGIGISPDGRSVYVGAARGFRISVYSRASDGELTYLERVRNTTNGVSGLAEPRDVKVSADGRTVYAASPNDDGLTAFLRDPQSGRLTFLGDYLENAMKSPEEPTKKFGPFGVGVSPDGHHVIAATTLAGDGSGSAPTSFMIFERHPGVGSLVLRRKVLQSEVDGQRGAWSVAFAPNGRFAYLATFDGLLTVDLRRELNVVDARTGELAFAPPLRGVYSDIAGTKALLLQTEIDAQLDSNDDGDRCDRRLRVLDTQTNVSKGVKPAIAEAAIGEEILAFTIDEAATNRAGDPLSSCTTGRPGTDLNGDGDDDDRVLAVSSPATSGDYKALGVDASDPTVTDNGVVFLSDTTAARRFLPGPACPVGTEGAEQPRFVHFYRGGASGDGTLIDLGYDAVDFVVGDGIVAMRVSEAAHGRILNNDGDCDDAIMVLLELPGEDESAGSVAARSTWRSARRCDAPGCLPGVPFRFEESTVSFLVHEQDEAAGANDLNHDGDSDDRVAARFSLDSAGVCVPLDPTRIVTDLDEDGEDDYSVDPAPPSNCPLAPMPGCHSASPSKPSRLTIRTGEATSDTSVKWRWTSKPGPGLASFGNPVTSSANYSMCIYDDGQLQSASVFLSSKECGGVPCWAPKSDKGFKLSRTEGLPSGVDTVTLRSVGKAGAIAFSLSASGENLEPPALPFTGPAVVQLMRHDSCGLSDCWEASMGRVKSNTATSFAAASAGD